MFIRGSRNRVQHVERNRINVQFLQMESHLDSLVEGFAQTEDAAAADADAGFLSTLDVLSFSSAVCVVQTSWKKEGADSMLQ